MEIIKRIGNLALAKTHSYGRNQEEYYEIVKYYPNPYYGKESEYVQTDLGNYAHPDYPHCFIDKTCFKNPESCYTIGIFEERDDDEPDFRSIGSRIVVEPSEINDLFMLIQLHYAKREV